MNKRRAETASRLWGLSFAVMLLVLVLSQTQITELALLRPSDVRTLLSGLLNYTQGVSALVFLGCDQRLHRLMVFYGPARREHDGAYQAQQVTHRCLAIMALMLVMLGVAAAA